MGTLRTAFTVTISLTAASLAAVGPAQARVSDAGVTAYTCDGQQATLVGTQERDHLVGTPGPDVIVALGRPDWIDARGGNDVICAGKGDDTIYGGRGDDRIFAEGNRTGPDDEYYGDMIHDGPGDDYMNGGHDLGTDYVYYDTATSPIRVDQPAARIVGDSSGHDTIALLGGVYGTPYDDVFIGSNDGSSFHGGAGDDRMRLAGGYDYAYGDAGNDRLIGGGGDDSLYGGPGDDYLDGTRGFDWGLGDAGTDTCIHVDHRLKCELR